MKSEIRMTKRRNRCRTSARPAATVGGHARSSKMARDRAIKLTIELVPRTCWYANLRKTMPKGKWDRLRRTVYAKASYKCEICGATDRRLHCHEMWTYDDKTRIQKLHGFICLCDLCHHVKHIGLAEILADRGELDFNALVRHFTKVNQVAKNDFEAHRARAFEQWRERSTHKWKTDLGKYASLVKATKSRQGLLRRT